MLFRFLKQKLTLIPFYVACVPYELTYRLTLFWIGLSRSHLWPRNSYYFKRIVMLVSDLDLTLFLEKGKELHKSTRQRVYLTQKVLPLLGEFNIVHEEFVKKYANLLPKRELERDPLLMEKTGLGLDNIDEAETFFFLWRMLWSDRKNLSSDLKLREKKWIFHLDSIGLDTDLFLKAGHYREFFENLDSQFECSMGYFQQLQLHFEKKNDFLREELKLVFFLSEWLGDIDRYNRWEKEESWPVLGPKLQDILKYALSWELWGVMTQFELHNNLSVIFMHITGLKKISSHYSCEYYLPALSELEGRVLDRMAL